MKPSLVRNRHSQIIQELGRQIVSGELKPGDVLMREESMAQHMSVSRTALRESLRVLASKGLIETRQKTGTRVREPRYWSHLDPDILAWRCETLPTQDFIDKLSEMREIIEPAAAASAAGRRSASQLARIRAAYQAMAAAQDMDAWARADLEFHESVLAATNNELMTSLFSVIETTLGTYFLISARKAAKDFKYSLPRHLAIYEAIKSKDRDLARQSMLDMIADSRDNMRRQSKARRA
jgi:DNA-binding FadR family transcriptional regulator